MSDIRFAEIVEVSPILKNPKKELSDENPVKAYKLRIDTGFEFRTVVSAVADIFTPDQLLGKTTSFVMDLPPAQIRGFVSEAMIHLNESTEKPTLFEGSKGEKM